MIYWSERQFPELAHLSLQERRSVWVSFASARPLTPKWDSDYVSGGIIIIAMTAGFGTGLFAFPAPSAVGTMVCGLAAILVGVLPGVLVHLYNINSESVRRDLKRFISHPAVISNPLHAVLAFRSGIIDNETSTA
jgi:hypothetical protein